MNFKEIIKEHKEIYFDNKDDLEEFLDLCAKEEILWCSGGLANKMEFVYDWFRDNGNYITIVYDNFEKLRHCTNKVDFTYNNFKKLLNSFDLAEFLKENGVRVLDEQQFNDMFNILDKHNIKYVDIKDKWHLAEGNGVFYYHSNDNHIMTVYKEYCKDVENILSYQDFISIYNSNNITNKKVEELNVISLKQDIEKYLIKDKEATNSYSDLLGFVNEINERFNLRIL